MSRLLCGTALALLLALPAQADIVVDLGVNPTSGTGAFSNTDPGTGGGGSGAFADIYEFDLFGTQVITIASVTNTFASLDQFIANFTGSVINEGADAAPGGGDDIVVIGPVAATPCSVPNCQEFAGTAILPGGEYYLLLTGIAGVNAGYGGNLSTFAVPGPEVGGLGSLVKLVAGLLH